MIDWPTSALALDGILLAMAALGVAMAARSEISGPLCRAALVVALGGAALTVAVPPDAAAAAPFLLLLFALTAASLACAPRASSVEDLRAIPLVPLLAAALGAALVSASPATAVAALAVCAWLALLARREDARARRAGLWRLGCGLVASAAAWLARAGPSGADAPWPLVAAGTLAAVAALAPDAGLRAPASAGAPLPAAMLLAGAGPALAVALAERFMLTATPAPPVIAGLPLLIAGALVAPWAAGRAIRARALPDVFGDGAQAGGGIALAALGLAVSLRGADLTAAGGMAEHAAVALAVGAGLAAATGLAACVVIADGAGSTRIDRLGGLAPHMPAAALCAMAALLTPSMLPPSLGFWSGWMLLQAAFGAVRIGGALGPALALIAALPAALAAALLTVAGLRVVAVALLGRPRTPRAAGAEERRTAAYWAATVLAGLLALAALVPDLASGASARVGGSTPVVMCLALAVSPWLAARAVRATQEAPAWEDGIKPPPWLPFGDPRAQLTPASFAAIGPRPLQLPRAWRGWRRLPSRPVFDDLGWMTAVLAALVGLAALA